MEFYLTHTICNYVFAVNKYTSFSATICSFNTVIKLVSILESIWIRFGGNLQLVGGK